MLDNSVFFMLNFTPPHFFLKCEIDLQIRGKLSEATLTFPTTRFESRETSVLNFFPTS